MKLNPIVLSLFYRQDTTDDSKKVIALGTHMLTIENYRLCLLPPSVEISHCIQKLTRQQPMLYVHFKQLIYTYIYLCYLCKANIALVSHYVIAHAPVVCA